jgi:hypothetical protein
MSEESVICWDLRLRVGHRLVLVMLRFHNLLNENASHAPMTHTQERMVLGALIAHKISLQGLNSRTACHQAGGHLARVHITYHVRPGLSNRSFVARRVYRRVAPKTMIGRTATELRDGWRTLSTGAALRSRIESGMCTESGRWHGLRRP